MLPAWTEGPEGLLRARLLAELPGVAHGFTTRKVAAQGDGAGHRLSGLAGGGPWRVVTATQVHGGEARVVPEFHDAMAPADGLVTRRPLEMVVVRTADCLPALLAAFRDGAPVAVAAAHAGWRGLLAGILESTWSLLAPPRGTSVAAAIGPAIGPCCFEIGPEVAQAWRARLGPEHLRPGRGDRSHADLPGAAAAILRGLGAEVAPAGPCTRCQPDRYHSHRAHGGAAGRAEAFIGIAP